jgi:hypothetical protein
LSRIFAVGGVIALFSWVSGCGGATSAPDAAGAGGHDASGADALDARGTGGHDASGGAGGHDADGTGGHDASGGAGGHDTDGAGGHDASGGVDATDGAAEGPGPDAAPADQNEDASDSAHAFDAATTEAATDVSSPEDGGTDTGPTISLISVVAVQNGLSIAGCGVAPGLFADIPAGSYTIELTASTLSKGSVSGTTPPTPSVDNYLIVNLPLPAGDPHQDQRFFTLNGIGASADVTLPALGTIQVMFIDSDVGSNSGQATVTLNPGGYSTTVSAVDNVVRWAEGCLSTPAALALTGVPHRVTLLDSTLSAASGSHDDYVLLRIPSEVPMEDHRFVILNGVGASYDFTPFNSMTLRAWFISTGGGGSGQATLGVVDR